MVGILLIFCGLRRLFCVLKMARSRVSKAVKSVRGEFMNAGRTWREPAEAPFLKMALTDHWAGVWSGAKMVGSRWWPNLQLPVA